MSVNIIIDEKGKNEYGITSVVDVTRVSIYRSRFILFFL